MTKNLTEFLTLIQVVESDSVSILEMEPAEFGEKLRRTIKFVNIDLKDNRNLLETKFCSGKWVLKMFQNVRRLVLEHNLTRVGKKICNILDFYFKLQL